MGEGGHENNGAIFPPVDLAVDFFKSNGCFQPFVEDFFFLV